MDNGQKQNSDCYGGTVLGDRMAIDDYMMDDDGNDHGKTTQ